MSISFAHSLVRNHGLPQGKTTVVCRNLGMQENPKAATPQLYHRTAQKVQVLETPAAETNPAYSVACTNSAANLADCRAQRVVKTCRNFPRSPAPGEVLHDRRDDRTEVEGHRFVLLNLEIIVPVDAAVGCRLQGTCRLALEGPL